MYQLAKKYWASIFKIIEHNPSSQIVESNNPHLWQLIRQTRLSIADLDIVPFWSDISQTSRLWIPSVNFWPWNISQAHTDDEFLNKEHFKQTYEQFREYIFN